MNTTYHVAVVHKFAEPVRSWRMNMTFGVHVLEQWRSMDEAKASAERHVENHNDDIMTEYRYDPCECGSDRCPGTDFTTGRTVEVEYDEADLIRLHVLPDNVSLHGWRSDDIRDGDLIVYPESLKGRVDTTDLRNSGKAFMLMRWNEDGSTEPMLATDNHDEVWDAWRALDIVRHSESFQGELGGMYDRTGTTADGVRYGILRFRERVWALEREAEREALAR